MPLQGNLIGLLRRLFKVQRRWLTFRRYGRDGTELFILDVKVARQSLFRYQSTAPRPGATDLP